MYSIVMLTAMSAGADVTPPAAPAAPVVIAPVGCGGCSGVVMSGCTGCSGYTARSGCCGGFLGMRSGGLFHRSSCHGCTGCTGSSCYGSCFGSCSGIVNYGSSWGPPVGMPPYTLHGYNTGHATWTAGAPVIVYGKVHNPNQPPVLIVPVAPIPKSSDALPVGANLIFKVPAGAKVYVDGKKDAEPGTGTTRAFYTPALAKGKKFFYEVEVKVKVKDKDESEKQTVVFEAGETKTVEFKTLIAAVEKAEKVAGK